MELRVVWARITYAQRILQADHLIIEGDSTTIVTWIQGCIPEEAVHPLHDIAIFLIGCTTIIIWYVYRETNFVVDWVVAFVTEHSGNILWTKLGEAPVHLWDILFSDFLRCIHTRII